MTRVWDDEKRFVACVVCGDEFLTARGRACPKCAQTFALQERVHSRLCVDCGAEFQTITVRAKRCVACRGRKRVPKSPCKQCGGEIPAESARRAYCGDTCTTMNMLDRAGKRTGDLYALACELGISGTRWRAALFRLLIERDGPDCQLCGDFVDLTLKGGPKGTRQGPSVDHILPKSLGGPDSLENLRMAHWGCNRDRKATMSEADRRAIQQLDLAHLPPRRPEREGSCPRCATSFTTQNPTKTYCSDRCARLEHARRRRERKRAAA